MNMLKRDGLTIPLNASAEMGMSATSLGHKSMQY